MIARRRQTAPFKHVAPEGGTVQHLKVGVLHLNNVVREAARVFIDCRKRRCACGQLLAFPFGSFAGSASRGLRIVRLEEGNVAACVRDGDRGLGVACRSAAVNKPVGLLAAGTCTQRIHAAHEDDRIPCVIELIGQVQMIVGFDQQSRGILHGIGAFKVQLCTLADHGRAFMGVCTAEINDGIVFEANTARTVDAFFQSQVFGDPLQVLAADFACKGMKLSASTSMPLSL